jgi:hypothetical protein
MGGASIGWPWARRAGPSACGRSSPYDWMRHISSRGVFLFFI